MIHASRGVRIFLIKRFLRIFLPYWPIALVLGAAYTLLPGLSAAAALLPPLCCWCSCLCWLLCCNYVLWKPGRFA